MELVKLETISPRKIWDNEAYDFTPWLANNLQELYQVTGLDLQFEGKEVPVGPFSADILAKDNETNDFVVIENQLEKTNHDHLGKCITYASVLGAKTIIWIATEFTEEHKKAMDWLNDNTSNDLAFFGIEIEVLKVSDDKASLQLNVISKPNTVVKAANEQKQTLTETAQKQLKFWTDFKKRMADAGSMATQTPRPQFWYDIRLGKSGILISNTYNTEKSQLGLRIYIRGSIANEMLPYLESKKEEIEKELGFGMTWNPTPEKKDKVITLNKYFDMSDAEEYEKGLRWLVEKTKIARRVFAKYVKAYN